MAVGGMTVGSLAPEEHGHIGSPADLPVNVARQRDLDLIAELSR